MTKSPEIEITEAMIDAAESVIYSCDGVSEGVGFFLPAIWQRRSIGPCVLRKRAIPVTINEETFMALEGHDRHEELRTNFNPQSRDLVSNNYLGRDCRKALSKGK